ncbi:MAG: autotransporter assembly complex protein TamA [Xanthomonadaceae bacterium]|jgi:translocation and assembly module TamA|nr:autotransporter assembly complex protein TamA [Xanthomonadaceae bacterium]
MRIQPLLSILAASCLLGAAPAYARGIIDKVVIQGLDKDADAEIIENIEASLSLYTNQDKPQDEARLEYLLLQAESQAREALEPFGFYSPTITLDTPRSDDDHITVTVHVDKGEPVRVRESHVALTGPAKYDRYMTGDLEHFEPGSGEVFNHATYESSKNAISRRLGERGYFDADFTSREVRVTRADHAADIDLVWDSGARYNMGPLTFNQDYFRPKLLDPLVDWEQGSYFHQGKLDRLRESLIKLDYFSVIDIQTRPDDAVGYEVPIDANLTLARRSIYTAGLSYGSESGTGVRLGLERRYVNARGHKLNTELDYAQNRKSLTTQYRIPAFRWLDGWYGFALSAYDEQTDYIDLRNIRFVASRSGEVNHHLTAIASLNVLRERWSYDMDANTDKRIYEYATLIYPELSATYTDVDDRMFPRRGFSANAFVRIGTHSDSAFAQAWMRLRWFQGLGESSRLILRGEGGATWTEELVGMPPSVRFFAGGDQSVRGYAFREVGPRTPPPDNYALGAKHVITASAEFEHYFNNGPWGAAAFVDAGDAFDNMPDFRFGVGIGVRWRSPIGPVRIDIAHGLDHPDSQFQIYLNIGTNL